MKMLAMRRENDQIFSNSTGNAAGNAIDASADAMSENCCATNSYHDSECVLSVRRHGAQFDGLLLLLL